MFTAIAGLAMILSASIDQRIEYKFRGNVAEFQAMQWKSVSNVMPDFKVSASAKGEAAGSWIFFDLPNNRAIVGGADAQTRQLVDFLEAFDVIPIPVKLSLAISRPDRGAELKFTIEVLDNQISFVGSPELDATVMVRPRINEDGTVTLSVNLTVGDKSSAISYRVKSKTPMVIDEGDLRLQGTELAKPATRGMDLWKPFRIEVVAEILKPQR